MQEELSKTVAKDQFARLLGIEIIAVEPGYAKVQMAITADHLNGLGVVQGGVIFTLADFAFAAATNTTKTTLGINATISYFKAPKGKTLTAIAKEIAAGNRLCHVNVEVFDEGLELIARFSGTGYSKRSTQGLALPSEDQ